MNLYESTYSSNGTQWHKVPGRFHLQVIRHTNGGSETIIDEVTETRYPSSGKVTICEDGVWIGEQMLIDGVDKTLYVEE